MAHFAKRTTTGKALGLSLEALRADYRLAELNETNCEANPIQQFQNWFHDAQAAELKEPNAMALATATREGIPSGRIVLLKEFGEFGFVFYTNYHSRKGRELEENPQCAATFYWAELERQVRVEGQVELVAREKSEAYFQGRPKGSRLGALVSAQSEILPSREPLETRLAELEETYISTDDVPLPDHWGGYCITPHTLEFWQGRTNRLHDRMRYRRKGENEWLIERLSP